MTRIRKYNNVKLDESEWNDLIDDYVSLSDFNNGTINVVTITRGYSGGSTADIYSGFLSVPYISNVWFLRSGYGSGHDDLLIRRYGTIALNIYNITDAKNIFSITDNGDISLRGKIYGISNIFNLYSNTVPLSAIASTTSIHVFTELDKNISITSFTSTISRLDITAQGSGSGTKEVLLTDFNSTITFSSISWTGNSLVNTFSSWTNLDISSAISNNFKIGIECSSSEDSETISFYKIDLQIQEVI